jgi:hypothetical protein
VLGTTSIASHARLYFNRGSSETICYVKAERLNPGWQLHQSRNPQQLNGCNTAAAETFQVESGAKSPFPTEFMVRASSTSIADKGSSTRAAN